MKGTTDTRSRSRDRTVVTGLMSILIGLGAGTAAAQTARTTASGTPSNVPAPIAQGSSRDSRVAGYLADRQPLDAVAYLPAPPAAGSAAQLLDDAIAREALALRGSTRWALAREDAELALPAAARGYECALGVSINGSDTPVLLRLMQRSLADAAAAVAPVKDKYQRPRPFMINGQPTCTPEFEERLRRNGAYPSGHAAIGWVWGLVLADVAPERTQALLTRGRAFAESRVVCNVHWRSDVLAGRDIATAVAFQLRGNAQYQQDIAAARRELAASRSKPARPADACSAEANALSTMRVIGY